MKKKSCPDHLRPRENCPTCPRADGAYLPMVLPLTYDGFGINQSDQYAARLLTLNVPPVEGLTPQQNDARRKAVAVFITRAVNTHGALLAAIQEEVAARACYSKALDAGYPLKTYARRVDLAYKRLVVILKKEARSHAR